MNDFSIDVGSCSKKVRIYNISETDREQLAVLIENRTQGKLAERDIIQSMANTRLLTIGGDPDTLYCIGDDNLDFIVQLMLQNGSIDYRHLTTACIPIRIRAAQNSLLDSQTVPLALFSSPALNTHNQAGFHRRVDSSYQQQSDMRILALMQRQEQLEQQIVHNFGPVEMFRAIPPPQHDTAERRMNPEVYGWYAKIFITGMVVGGVVFTVNKWGDVKKFVSINNLETEKIRANERLSLSLQRERNAKDICWSLFTLGGILTKFLY